MNPAQDLVERLHAEIPDWGHLPAIGRFKREAVARFGVEAAFGLCQAHLASLVRPKKMPQERALAVAPLMARYPELARDLAGAIDISAREHLVVTLG